MNKLEPQGDLFSFINHFIKIYESVDREELAKMVFKLYNEQYLKGFDQGYYDPYFNKDGEK